MIVSLNPAVRVTPPSDVTGDRWTAENLLQRRGFVLSRPAAAALVAAARPQTAEELAKRLADIPAHPRPADYWLRILADLRERGLILDQSAIGDDPGIDWLVDVRRRWSSYGWHEAAEYHLLSFDYPCVDYSEAIAIVTDRDRMRGYQADEADQDRFKLDYSERPGTALPKLDQHLIETSARAVWQSDVPPAAVGPDTLRKTLSAAFAATGFIVPKTDSAPLLRRSSPSGGGRNPTEGYVAVRDIEGLEPGWYHVTMKPFSLRRLNVPAPDDAALQRLFPNTAQRFPLSLRALVVLTSVFERNMYRYREPRTYRTVHMDAGHIAGTLRVAARALGLTAAVFYCDAATEIEDALGLDGMAEGYMLTVALADGQREQLQIPQRPGGPTHERTRPTTAAGKDL
ncbi:SagB/ThcOx family dehydrogenase [Streptomyces sp. NPDC088847]|uniref:SagB/ThcOx family dehydrogenase n=1 Tax=Streptomyces sp. NPDC088847 TaxID=3365909 RepID=UPI0037FEABCD